MSPKNSAFRLFCLASAIAFLFGCTRSISALDSSPGTVRSDPAREGARATATLFLSADLRGYLGPCGCAEAMRGGIERAAFQVLEAHKGRTPVFYLDGGDSLFGSTSIPAVQIPQQQRKAQAIAEAFQLMQIQAHALGELDDARGLNFRKSLGLPDLADGDDRRRTRSAAADRGSPRRQDPGRIRDCSLASGFSKRSNRGG